MLSKKHLEDICLINSNNHLRCRYLAQDDNDSSKYYCCKKISKKQDIDDEIAEVLKDARKKGIDPKKQGSPLGDNCDGYPVLKGIEQGYDKD